MKSKIIAGRRYRTGNGHIVTVRKNEDKTYPFKYVITCDDGTRLRVSVTSRGERVIGQIGPYDLVARMKKPKEVSMDIELDAEVLLRLKKIAKLAKVPLNTVLVVLLASGVAKHD